MTRYDPVPISVTDARRILHLLTGCAAAIEATSSPASPHRDKVRQCRRIAKRLQRKITQTITVKQHPI